MQVGNRQAWKQKHSRSSAEQSFTHEKRTSTSERVRVDTMTYADICSHYQLKAGTEETSTSLAMYTKLGYISRTALKGKLKTVADEVKFGGDASMYTYSLKRSHKETDKTTGEKNTKKLAETRKAKEDMQDTSASGINLRRVLC